VFKNDRLISILSGVVLMIAIGTVVQRGDSVAEFFGTGRPEVVLKPDSATVMADELVKIDVLHNDVGVARSDGERLVVLVKPDCGRVFVQAGALQYLPGSGCAGEQRMRYGLADMPGTGDLSVTVLPRPEAMRLAGASPAAAAEDTRPRLRSAPRRTDRIARVATAPASLEITPRVPDPAETPATARVDRRGAAPSGPISSAADRRLTGSVDSPDSRPVPAAPVAPDASSGRTPQAPMPEPRITGGEDPQPRRMAEAPREPRGNKDAGASPLDRLVARYQASEAIGPSAPARRAQGAEATISLARIESGAALGRVARPAAPAKRRNPQSLDARVPRTSLPEIDAGGASAVAFAAPASGLGPVLGLGRAPRVEPVDTREPVALTPPKAQDNAMRTAAIAPTRSTPIGAAASAKTTTPASGETTAPASAPAPTTAGEDETGDAVSRARTGDQAHEPRAGGPAASRGEPVAALSPASEGCAVPPGVTLERRPSGETVVGIVSPCDAGSTVALAYSGLVFAVPLDSAGEGRILAPGFTPRAKAKLRFGDRATLAFDLPFAGLERIERIALVWEMPVRLELHALEFDAAQGSSGHIRPDHRRSFEAVRRHGGGYLRSFVPIDGVGQNLEVYTYWKRRGGQRGIVKLFVDFASRHRDRQAGTCGGGPLAAPEFAVVRSSGGKIDHALPRRLPAIGCAELDATRSHLIANAVRDVVVSRK